VKRLLLLALLQASPAHADVTLGAVLSLTGPGAGSRNLFGATLWDSVLVLDRAAGPALATAGPGTPEFRVALRNAMERVHGLAGAEGVFSLSPSDHSGAELGSQVLIEIRGGGYRLVPS
jgi:branched-chain amino acid transport system substrate-binding protein